MTEATADGALARGWIPAWIPADATNLREVHDLDTNTSALAFDIPERSGWRLPDHCRLIDDVELTPTRFDRAWWPTDQELGASYSFFRCESDASPEFTFAGIHVTGRHGLHWRAHAR